MGAWFSGTDFIKRGSMYGFRGIENQHFKSCKERRKDRKRERQNKRKSRQ